MAIFSLNKDQLAFVLACFDVGFEGNSEGAMNDEDYAGVDDFMAELTALNEKGLGAEITVMRVEDEVDHPLQGCTMHHGMPGTFKSTLDDIPGAREALLQAGAS